jgi:hypothetical protein
VNVGGRKFRGCGFLKDGYATKDVRIELVS